MFASWINFISLSLDLVQIHLNFCILSFLKKYVFVLFKSSSFIKNNLINYPNYFINIFFHFIIVTFLRIFSTVCALLQLKLIGLKLTSMKDGSQYSGLVGGYFFMILLLMLFVLTVEEFIKIFISITVN